MKYLYGFLILFLIGNYSCKPSKDTLDTSTLVEANRNATKVDNPALSLKDYLRRIPGVSFSGNQIFIRGIASLSDNSGGSRDPLFVIDGNPISQNFQQLSSTMDVNDIKKVKVLKSYSETSSYGLRGSNGVIVITTK